MTNNIKKPPVLGNWLLKTFSRSEYQVALLEAIEDEYYEICANDSIFKARKWFRYQVIRSLPILVLGGFYLRLISVKDYVGFHSRRVSKTKYLFRFRVLLPVNVVVLSAVLTSSMFTSFVLCNKAPTDPQYPIDGIFPISSSSVQPNVIFCSNKEKNVFQIYALNIQSKQVINLSRSLTHDIDPVWSPDGSKIAYVSGDEYPFGKIYVMNSDGSGKVCLTKDIRYSRLPAWSPDGSKITFSGMEESNWDIFVMNSDGSDKVRLTHSYAHDNGSAWSPDGSKIVFVSERDYPNGISAEVADNWEMYIMNADGSDKQRLTNNHATEGLPSISPDGSKILYYSNVEGNFEIYTMDIDGSNVTRLTFNDVSDYSPAWSPDGLKILTESGVDGEDFDIYMMNADGSERTRLTFDTAGVQLPKWYPIAK